MSATSPLFRPDIEGLRALAVMLVVAVHAGVPGLAGGFIGVDIFFVISGYLITRQLHQEWKRDARIDIPAFYVRRLRRLVPAFAVMLAVVLVAIRVIFSPLEQPQLLSSAFASTLYFSNIHYALESTRYLADASSLDPLLHTWSLGVEEQFYLVWPFLLLLAGRAASRPAAGVNPFAIVLGAILIVSLALCLYLTPSRQPLAFFLPLTRAWEFAAGALVALSAEALLLPGAKPAKVLARRMVANGLTLFAAALIVGAAAGLSENSLFPGYLAILPVAGTAILILIVPAAPAGTLITRLLALPVMQWLGRLSYSWYLWHWPMLVVGRMLVPEPGLIADLALVAGALVLAQLSYRWIEQPTRTAPLLQRKAPVFGTALLLVAAGSFSILQAGSSAIDIATGDRFQHLQAARHDLPALYSKTCEPSFYDSRLLECESGNPAATRTVVLLGDSHAGQWFSALNAIATARGWRLIVMTKSSCPVIERDLFNPRIGRVFHECRQWRQKAIDRIRQLQPDLVMVSSYEHYDLTAAQWREGLQKIMLPLADASRHLVVLRDTPAPGFNPPVCLARREWNTAFTLPACTFRAEASLSPVVLSALQAITASRADMHLMDMTPAICPETPCSVTSGGTMKYRDTHHLTDSFVRQLVPAFRQALEASGAM